MKKRHKLGNVYTTHCDHLGISQVTTSHVCIETTISISTSNEVLIIDDL